jgi:acetyl esterase/lipase
MALVVASLWGGAVVAAPPVTAGAQTVTFTTIEKLYGSHPILQKLTAYVPNTTGKKPAILFVHGGCWRRGGLVFDETQLAKEIVRRTGYVVAVMTYREADPRYANQPADVSAALHALQTTSSMMVDATRVALWGESAGGHLSLLKAYRSTGSPGVDRPAAVVSVSGISDMKTAYSSAIRDCVRDFEGGEPTSKPRVMRYEETSGINHVDPADPATFLAHATVDKTVPYDQSAKLSERLGVSKVDHQLVTVAGQHHATAAEYDVPTGQHDPVYVLAIRFLQARFH